MILDSFVYKGYCGSMIADPEDGTYYGFVKDIPDMLCYVGKTPEDLKIRFEEAIDTYLDNCKFLNRKPHSLV